MFNLTEGTTLYKGDTKSFYGLNRKRKGGQGEFEDMENMSSDEYPCITPRKPRKSIFSLPGEILAAAAPDTGNVSEMTGFTGIANEMFYYNGTVKNGIKFSSSFKWKIIRMGNLYIINGFKRNGSSFESSMYYYNSDTDKLSVGAVEMDSLILTAGKNSTGSYLATFRYGFDEVYDYSVTDTYGNEIKNSEFYDKYANGRNLPETNIFSEYFSVGDELQISGFPSRSENTGQVWTHSGSDVLQQRAQDFSANNTLDTDMVYDLEEFPDHAIASAIVTGFSVTELSLSGSKIYVHYIFFNLMNKNGESMDFDNMTSDSATFYCSGIKLRKRTRVFDNITVHHGRIWGTIPTGNTIFASSSDNIFSFSSDDISKMYAVRLPSDTEGNFTGLCEYNDEVCAFKENSITIIYGSNSSNYAQSIIRGIGCIDGESIAVTLDGVIFLSTNGFYLYSGGIPTRISDNLNEKYVSACGRFDGIRYYVSTVTDKGVREFLVYDMRYGTWHKQDDFAMTDLFLFKGKTYIVSGNNVYETENGDENVLWSITSVKIYDDILDNKSVNEIWIHAEICEGAEFSVYTSCGSGEFIKHFTFSEPGIHIFRCPVRLMMSAYYRYKIEGKGEAVIYEIEMVKSQGGRRYKEF